ncbi:hypothetical protein CBR_g73131, partial [Chara braunii]
DGRGGLNDVSAPQPGSPSAGRLMATTVLSHPAFKRPATAGLPQTQRAQRPSRPRAAPEEGPSQPRKTETISIEEDDGEEDELLRAEDERHAKQRAMGKEPETGKADIGEGELKKKKQVYTIPVEQGLDIEQIVDRILESQRDLFTLKEFLASSSKILEESRHRLSRKKVMTVKMSDIFPQEISWAPPGTKMDWHCVATGLLKMQVGPCEYSALIDDGAEMNIIREREAMGAGVNINRADTGFLVGASGITPFCGTASDVTVQNLQKLNSVTVWDAGGLPHADQLSESCAGRPIITLIDLYSGYDEFLFYTADRPMTAMHTPRGLIHMCAAPQGWTKAVAIVQRYMMRVMQPLCPDVTSPYIDDLAIPGPRVKDETKVLRVRKFVWEHVRNVEKVLSKLKEYNLTASGVKSRHCMREATILGFLCDEKGRQPDSKKTNKILEWPTPLKSITDVRSFLGTCGFWRIFIRKSAARVEHLRKFVHKNQEWEWGPKQQAAVDDIKAQFREEGLILGVPYFDNDPNRPFVV